MGEQHPVRYADARRHLRLAPLPVRDPHEHRDEGLASMVSFTVPALVLLSLALLALLAILP